MKKDQEYAKYIATTNSGDRTTSNPRQPSIRQGMEDELIEHASSSLFAEAKHTTGFEGMYASLYSDTSDSNITTTTLTVEDLQYNRGEMMT